MMLDHYQQTKNMLVSYSPKAARLLLRCFGMAGGSVSTPSPTPPHKGEGLNR